MLFIGMLKKSRMKKLYFQFNIIMIILPAQNLKIRHKWNKIFRRLSFNHKYRKTIRFFNWNLQCKVKQTHGLFIHFQIIKHWENECLSLTNVMKLHLTLNKHIKCIKFSIKYFSRLVIMKSRFLQLLLLKWHLLSDKSTKRI